MQNKISIKKRILSILILFSIIFQLVPKPAEAIEPWSAEMSAIGTPGVDSSDYEGYSGDGWENVIKALNENRLYISTVNKPFHVFEKGGKKYAEVPNWDGKTRTELVKPGSHHKVKFVIPMPKGCRLLSITNLFASQLGVYHPDDRVLTPEKWVSYLPDKVKAKEWYGSNQALVGLSPEFMGLENVLMKKSTDEKTKPGYFIQKDKEDIVLNVYLQFALDGGYVKDAYENAENTTEILKDFWKEYQSLQKQKKDPDFSELEADFMRRVKAYKEKVGPEAWRVQGPYITTGRMLKGSKLEGQLAYYSNPTIYFTPIDDCPSHVHKYYYTKKGDHEVLVDYKTEFYQQQNGYNVKNENGYQVVAWHTMNDDVRCKPDPNLPTYEAALGDFNNIAQGKEPDKIPSDKTTKPDPDGSEIAIKLIKEVEEQEPPKEVTLILTQKRISKKFDLSPWKKEGEEAPVILTYHWPKTSGCVCETCNPPGPCVDHCWSIVEPSMTFLVKQTNHLNKEILADVEYFKAYEENNIKMVGRGDDADKDDVRPNYHFIIYRGKDLPTLASYKYRTDEAKEEAGPLYKNLISMMDKVPEKARYGLNDPNYDAEVNKGIIYTEKLSLTFGPTKTWYYMQEDLEAVESRPTCGDPIYQKIFASPPAPKNLTADVIVHCYHGLPNEDAGKRLEDDGKDGKNAPQDGMIIDGVKFNSVWGKNSNDHTVSFYPYVEMVYDSTGWMSEEKADLLFEDNKKIKEEIDTEKKSRSFEVGDITRRITDYKIYTERVLWPRLLFEIGYIKSDRLPKEELVKELEEKLGPFKYHPMGLEVPFNPEIKATYEKIQKETNFSKRQKLEDKLKELVNGDEHKKSELNRVLHQYKLKLDKRDVIKGDMVRDMNNKMKEMMEQIKRNAGAMAKKEEPVLTLAGHESKFIGRHYVETGYIKAPLKSTGGKHKADSGLLLLSQQWSTHQRAANLGEKNTVLPGGAIYRLMTPEEGAIAGDEDWKNSSRTKVGASYYLTYVPEDVRPYLSKKNDTLTLDNAKKAVFGTADINGTSGSASTIYKGLNSLDIVQVMENTKGSRNSKNKFPQMILFGVLSNLKGVFRCV